MKKLILLSAFLIALINCPAQFTKLHDFDETNGAVGMGSLLYDGTSLYGMTSGGGDSTRGTIFKLFPDGTGFTKIFDFGGLNGQSPISSLISDGTFLYGMTCFGGIHNEGVIFKILPDGSGFVKLLDFDSINGTYPAGNLVSDGAFLYGCTSIGGVHNKGTIFKIKPDGTEFTQLYNFDSIHGSLPAGSLVYDGTFLYGAAATGVYEGNIFKIRTDGTGFTDLYDFGSAGHPEVGGLVYDGTSLYGMTLSGGIHHLGTIFKINPDGMEYTKLLDFDSTLSGQFPYGSLAYDGVFLYGMAISGGANNLGTLFKILPDGTGFANLFNFNDTSGSYPVGGPITDGTFLYGMTPGGGTNNLGTVFKFAVPPYCISHYTTDYDSTSNTFILNIDSLTTASAVSYHWDFGDGTTSTLSHPSHVYSVDSLYNVCMEIYTSTGDSCEYCHTIGIDSAGNIIRDGGFALTVHNTAAGVSETAAETAITVYPNPTSGIFQLTMDKIMGGQLFIYNVMGDRIYSKDAKQLTTNSTIDLSDQPNGIYFIQLQTGKNTVTKKIIVNK